MAKAIIHISLSLMILLNGLVFSVIQMDFTINRAYIIENFCVNKDKPMLHCDGQCFLAEKLKKAQDQKENQAGGIEFNRDFGIFILQEASISLSTLPSTTLNHGASYQEAYRVSQFVDIFHPPKAIA
ncbi:hypothetical protein [Cyclobacterium marinum]|uniref:Uncharacterized protein n=1 Tax=Cyclobacterium marinum (strain ATCC 25205 / DSM 745 / LMG 13164 / NCIMB 1802) TaxID=880070 RepID=G0IWT7_CYCMS|nr:hypothetical protein [Cyclobacterium marinum]AEL24279.1 hypothetical protein Cycma_0502 [Cyclobacterium marinum DSM 745]